MRGFSFLSIKYRQDKTTAYFLLSFIFNPAKEGSINSIVGTHNKTLMVYCDVTLIWAAQLPHMPVAVRIASFQ